MHPYQDDENQQILKHNISQYYRRQSQIYDITRWSFLFGRRYLIEILSPYLNRTSRITEFGSGTGSNLLKLGRRFPDASLTGIDLSPEMLEITRRRTQPFRERLSLHQCMDFSCLEEAQDLILFSYCLSMINPGWQNIIDQALASLSPGGMIAVVDFNTTPLGFYKSFMRNNHVEVSGEVYPFLQKRILSLHAEAHNAYFRAWSYFTFLGSNKA